MAITQRRPTWYTAEDDTAWGKVKAAFRRDWEQTKHDLGGKAPNLNQQVGDTVSQAAGSKPIPPGNVPTSHPKKEVTYNEAEEPAYQYGYIASRHFCKDCNDASDIDWDEETETNLRDEWGDDSEWEEHREAVRRGWLYGKNQGRVNRPK